MRNFWDLITGHSNHFCQGRYRKSIFQGQCQNSSKLKPLMFAWLRFPQQRRGRRSWVKRTKRKEEARFCFFFYFIQAKTISFHSKAGQKIKVLKRRRFSRFGVWPEIWPGTNIIFLGLMTMKNFLPLNFCLQGYNCKRSLKKFKVLGCVVRNFAFEEA